MPPALAQPFRFVFLPSGLMVLLLVAAFLLLLARRRAGLWPLGGALALALACLTPLPGLLLHPLEERFPTPRLPARVDGIIVLGGAVQRFMTQDRGLPALNGMAERMTEGVALARQYPSAKLIFTGGPVDPGRITEAEVARRLFNELGVAPARVLLERRSATTWENAKFSYQLIRPRAGQTWLLVTSASHMPRSMGTFRAAGWTGLVPWPVDHRTYRRGLIYQSSLQAGLETMDIAAYEWIGLLSYWLAGRSNDLFPAPQAISRSN